jgi:polar amino acid transport system substrate-binding protein
MQRYVLWAVCTLALSLAVAPTSALELRICYDNKDQPPYYLGDGAAIDWQKPGMSVEIIKAAAEAAGIEPQFARQPWLRCLENLQDGHVDAIFNSSYTPDRLKYGFYPGQGDTPDRALRIATLSYSFYRRKGADVAWSGKSLTGQHEPIGVVHGFSISQDLQKMGLRIEESASNEQVFKMLAAGRVPVVALQTVTGDRLLRSGQYSNLETMEPPIMVKDYYVMLSRQYVTANPTAAAQFWGKIASLREPMTAQLTSKYGG